jgi:hypothetical protein
VTTTEQFIDPPAETNGTGRLSSPVDAAYAFMCKLPSPSSSEEAAKRMMKSRIFLTLLSMLERVMFIVLSSMVPA